MTTPAMYKIISKYDGSDADLEGDQPILYPTILAALAQIDENMCARAHYQIVEVSQ